MPKRVLTELKIGRIAAVDVPCQEDAQAAILKRATLSARVWKGKYTSAQRKQMAASGQAMADGSYPVCDGDDLDRAIAAVGPDSDDSQAPVRAHIKARARTLDLAHKIPDGWQGSEIGKALLGLLAKAGVAADANAQGFAYRFEDQLTVQNLLDEYWKAQNALQQSIESIVGDDTVAGKPAMIRQSLDEFCEYLSTLVPQTPQPAAPNDADEATIAKMIDGGEAFRALDGSLVTKKAAGPNYRLMKALNDSAARNAADIAKREEETLTAAFAKRATALGFGAMFGATLRKAYSGDMAAQADIETRIAALNTQVEESRLFASFGKASPEAGSAEHELLARRDALLRTNPRLTTQQAYVRVYKARENADVVKRMKAEQHG
jgi:hypothetical protein